MSQRNDHPTWTANRTHNQESNLEYQGHSDATIDNRARKVTQGTQPGSMNHPRTAPPYTRPAIADGTGDRGRGGYVTNQPAVTIAGQTNEIQEHETKMAIEEGAYPAGVHSQPPHARTRNIKRPTSTAVHRHQNPLEAESIVNSTRNSTAAVVSKGDRGIGRDATNPPVVPAAKASTETMSFGAAGSALEQDDTVVPTGDAGPLDQTMKPTLDRIMQMEGIMAAQSQRSQYTPNRPLDSGASGGATGQAEATLLLPVRAAAKRASTQSLKRPSAHSLKEPRGVPPPIPFGSAPGVAPANPGRPLSLSHHKAQELSGASLQPPGNDSKSGNLGVKGLNTTPPAASSLSGSLNPPAKHVVSTVPPTTHARPGAVAPTEPSLINAEKPSVPGPVITNSSPTPPTTATSRPDGRGPENYSNESAPRAARPTPPEGRTGINSGSAHPLVSISQGDNVAMPELQNPDNTQLDPNVDWGRRLEELIKSREQDASPPPDTSNGTAASKKLDGLRNLFKADRINDRDVKPDDVVIVLMGPTGAGKSSFISIASNIDDNDLVRVGHNLQSCTSKIDMYRISSPLLVDRDIVLVDTPGFDDTTMSDAETLKLVSEWLKDRYNAKTLLAGLLYFHRISDNRMAGTPLKNLRMFQKLCGHEGLSKVILVTTMWDMLENDEIGEDREKQLMEQFWHDMITLGSRVQRFKHGLWSALDILRLITDPIKEIQQGETRALIQESANLAAVHSQTPPSAPLPRKMPWFRNGRKPSVDYNSDTPRPASPLPNIQGSVPLRLQTELVDEGKQLRETGAGKELFSKLQDLVERREKVLERLRNEIKLGGEEGIPPVALVALTEELGELQREFDEANKALSELKLKGMERLIGALNRMRPSGSLFQFFRRLMPSHSRPAAS